MYLKKLLFLQFVKYRLFLCAFKEIKFVLMLKNDIKVLFFEVGDSLYHIVGREYSVARNKTICASFVESSCIF